MKALYNLVTFLAAIIIIAGACWQTYLHWGVLTSTVNKSGKVTPATIKKPSVCKCCKTCVCKKDSCNGCCEGSHCCEFCRCADKDCCKP